MVSSRWLARRTIGLIVIAGIILICANAIPLRIPFVGEQEADGYMLKIGWPCAFWEQTRHRTMLEQRDIAIDAAVALISLALVACGSEWTLRTRRNFARYVTILFGAALMIAVNLHEQSTAQLTLRGWPAAAIINGDFGASGIHHNRINVGGAALDLAVGVAAIVGLMVLSKFLGMEQRLAQRIGG